MYRVTSERCCVGGKVLWIDNLLSLADIEDDEDLQAEIDGVTEVRGSGWGWSADGLLKGLSKCGPVLQVQLCHPDPCSEAVSMRCNTQQGGAHAVLQAQGAGSVMVQFKHEAHAAQAERMVRVSCPLLLHASNTLMVCAVFRGAKWYLGCRLSRLGTWIQCNCQWLN